MEKHIRGDRQLPQDLTVSLIINEDSLEGRYAIQTKYRGYTIRVFEDGGYSRMVLYYKRAHPTFLQADASPGGTWYDQTSNRGSMEALAYAIKVIDMKGSHNIDITEDRDE